MYVWCILWHFKVWTTGIQDKRSQNHSLKILLPASENTTKNDPHILKCKIQLEYENTLMFLSS